METTWESILRRAKNLESALENEIQRYTTFAHQFQNNAVDEENLLLNDDHGLSNDIEHHLAELYDCIQSMRQVNGGSLSNQQEVWLKRYYEIHFDYSNEYKTTSESILRKRDAAELMRGSEINHSGRDSAISQLLREKSAISNAMKGVHEVVGQALEAKSTLVNQRSMITGSSSGLSSISSSIPTLGQLIEGIQNKKGRETVVLALVIGILISFTLW